MDKTHHNWFKPHLDRAQQLVEQFNHRPPDEITKLGTHIWYKYGDIERGISHRDGDLPAIIRADGTLEWYRNGQRHRDGDQPAISWTNGTKIWFHNGLIYRDGDLPAYIGKMARNSGTAMGNFIVMATYRLSFGPMVRKNGSVMGSNIIQLNTNG